MCLVMDGGNRSTGFGCGICRMPIYRQVPTKGMFDERYDFGRVENDCDPLVAEIDGALMTLCHRCARNHFPEGKLHFLSHPDMADFRQQKLDACRAAFGVAGVVVCDVLERRIGLMKHELVST